MECKSFSPRLSSPTSSDDEPESVTRLISRAEDLDAGRVFQRDSLDLATNRSLFEYGHNFEDVPDWLKIEQPSKLPLKAVLRYMVENHLKTSVQVKIAKLYFNCHVIVLQVYSKYFMDLPEIPLVVTLPDDKVSQKAFLLVYQWMLSDNPRLDRKNIIAVFMAATYLRIDALLQHCWKYFEDTNCFNEATACIMYVEAKNNPALDIVRNLMLTRIHKFLLTFVATHDFLDMPISHVVYLLSSNEICVNTEVEVRAKTIIIAIIFLYIFVCFNRYFSLLFDGWDSIGRNVERMWTAWSVASASTLCRCGICSAHVVWRRTS